MYVLKSCNRRMYCMKKAGIKRVRVKLVDFASINWDSCTSRCAGREVEVTPDARDPRRVQVAALTSGGNLLLRHKFVLDLLSELQMEVARTGLPIPEELLRQKNAQSALVAGHATTVHYHPSSADAFGRQAVRLPNFGRGAHLSNAADQTQGRQHPSQSSGESWQAPAVYPSDSQMMAMTPDEQAFALLDNNLASEQQQAYQAMVMQRLAYHQHTAALQFGHFMAQQQLASAAHGVNSAAAAVQNTAERHEAAASAERVRSIRQRHINASG